MGNRDPSEARESEPAHDGRTALGQLEDHRVLFGPRLLRSELRRVPQCDGAPVAIHVVRNFPAEYALGVLGPFLGPARLVAEVTYSEYDDALSARVPSGPDVVVVWLDFARYPGRYSGGFLDWLASRIAAARASTSAPIIVVASDLDEGARADFNAQLGQHVAAIAGVLVVDPGVTVGNTSASEATQSRHDGRRTLELARRFGTQWIPAALHRTVRLVAVDLDNTLYEGVLGEDGIEGLVPTATHQAVLQRLANLAEQGVLVALVSKNEADDVDDLLDSGRLAPLQRHHLVDVKASWQPKVQSITELLELTRLGAAAVLFVDDNPGELAAAAAGIPDLHLAHAATAEQTLAALTWYPGLWRSTVRAEDLGRAADLRANAARAAANTSEPAAYLAQLSVEVMVDCNPSKFVPRLAELSNKTNQFNTGFRRLTEAEILARIASPSGFVAAVTLRDRLSDSGVVAVVSGVRETEEVRVDEISVSCRALGRGVEDLIVEVALDEMVRNFGDGPVVIDFVEGPRNGPARDWLARNAHVERERWVWKRQNTMASIGAVVTVIVHREHDPARSEGEPHESTDSR